MKNSKIIFQILKFGVSDIQFMSTKCWIWWNVTSICAQELFTILNWNKLYLKQAVSIININTTNCMHLHFYFYIY